MDDIRLGRSIRVIRVRKGWRQADLASAAGVSQQTVSRIERGDVAGMPLSTLARVCAALGARMSVAVHGEGAELDRLLGARHSAMHEEMALVFGELPEWVLAPEVTFSIFGERGAIDILAWHAPTRTLLVIELKTELVDVQDTVGRLDRKVRLAAKIAAERGWVPLSVGGWLVVAEGATNRRRVAAHRAMLRAAYPADGRAIAGWLASPHGTIAALSFLSSTHRASPGPGLAQVNRVRRPGARTARPAV